MAAFVRTQVVDASPGADTVKAAVIDVDTDLTGVVAAYNAHDTATTNVHGSTGAATGTGAMVRATSPALVTPALGVATATSINKVAMTAPATSATLTIANLKTLTASNTLTMTATDGSTLAIGTGGTLGSAAYTASTAYDVSGAAAGKIASSISDGDTTHAPDGNSVFDALALKAPKANPVFTGIVTTAGQIAFPAAANPSADPNTLDDYEEGTWTPVYEGSSGSIGATASTTAGYYTKIGNTVKASGKITLTNNGDWTGSATFKGLPFTAKAEQVAGIVSVVNITYDGQLSCYIAGPVAYFYIGVVKTGTSLSVLQCTGIPDNGELIFELTYLT